MMDVGGDHGRRAPDGRRGAAAGAGRAPLHRRPARRRGGRVHLLPGGHGPGGHLRLRPRGAGGRSHRARGAGAGRQPGSGSLHQPAAPSRLGPGAGDLRRGLRAHRRDGRGLRARPAEARHGLRQALRLQQHRELAASRWTCACARGARHASTCPTSSGWSTKAWRASCRPTTPSTASGAARTTSC